MERLFSTGKSALLRAEEKLFASAMSWWRQWQADASVPVITHADLAGIHYVTASTGATPPADSTPLVCLHGYSSGCGIYYAALAPLAERWAGAPVYLLDSPGCGLSDRPKWKLPR